MAAFTDLIDDVILLMPWYLATERDLNSLSRTTRHIHSLLNPLLYDRHVRFHGSSALTWAAKHDRADVAEKLLAAGADVMARTAHEGWLPPLAAAAQNGSVGVTKLLFETEGVDLNWMNDRTPPALCLAAEGGYVNVVELYLADPRANPQMLDAAGRTAACYAAENAQPMALEILLRDGHINPSNPDEDDCTPLFYAGWSKHENNECIGILLADPRVDAFATERRGRTALHLAAQHGHEANVQTLLDAGLDPNHQLADGSTPLMAAVDWAVAGAETVKVLLCAPGVDPNLRNNSGYTPLIMGAMHTYVASVSCLLEDSRVLPNLACPNGSTALMHACMYGYHRVALLLLDHPYIDVNIAGRGGRTALHHAIGSGKYDCVEALLEDERLDAARRDGDGKTPMMLAAVRGDVGIIRLIWMSGRCSIDERDGEGRNAMSYAAARGRTGGVDCLLEIERETDGVDWMLCDNLGRDPLWYARENGHDYVIDILEKSRGRHGHDN